MQVAELALRIVNLGEFSPKPVADRVCELFVSQHDVPLALVGSRWSLRAFRRLASAIDVVDFTVPSAIPRAAAVSATERSTTKRRTDTSRCGCGSFRRASGRARR